jgi:Glycosyltransferase Maf N-terminal domain
VIERSLSRSQHTVLKINGNYVCSSVDPLSEAKKWVQKNNSKIQSVDTVIVLGVGCGYHIAALAKAHLQKKIIAIDIRSEFIDFAKSENSLDLIDVQFVSANSTAQLKTSTVIKKAIATSYTVLHFAAAKGAEKEKYNDIENFLLSRTEEGLQFILSERKDLGQIFQTQSMRGTVADLISIKTLEKLMRPEIEHDEKLIFQTLRELVN